MEVSWMVFYLVAPSENETTYNINHPTVRWNSVRLLPVENETYTFCMEWRENSAKHSGPPRWEIDWRICVESQFLFRSRFLPAVVTRRNSLGFDRKEFKIAAFLYSQAGIFMMCTSTFLMNCVLQNNFECATTAAAGILFLHPSVGVSARPGPGVDVTKTKLWQYIFY